MTHLPWTVGALAPLAFWILLSGFDDLFLSLVWLISRKQFDWPPTSQLDHAPERRIAILVPLWNEHAVIGSMLERNLAAIRYGEYDIFAGVYPNDEPTLRAVSEAAARNPRVHAAAVPHAGPTSKGDCLNWIWQRMREYEAAEGVRFEIIVVHDAEDLIHPESLRLVNWFSREFEMIQVPVLALPTGLGEFTHGVYCDEFADSLQRDIPVRQRLGGFLPSCGVGAGFAREALEQLAKERHGRVFDADALTEDYESGYLLHSMGYRQIFLPVRGRDGVATREYFPRNFRAAVRQRSRWVAGIALQGWQRHGWGGSWRQRYWLWRDRKGLVGNLLSPLANLLFCYGLARPAALSHIPPPAARLCAAALAVAMFQLCARAFCVSRVYGWPFAAAVPLRAWWGNLVNAAATAAAIRQFIAARRKGRSPAWRKTDHVYPAHALSHGRPRVGEVLVRIGCLRLEELEDALQDLPAGMRLGEWLVNRRKISEESLYRALSLQSGVELGAPGTPDFDANAIRALPLRAIRDWKVMPYRIHLGHLHLLTPEVPNEEMTASLTRYSDLRFRFRLVAATDFSQLYSRYYC